MLPVCNADGNHQECLTVLLSTACLTPHNHIEKSGPVCSIHLHLQWWATAKDASHSLMLSCKDKPHGPLHLTNNGLHSELLSSCAVQLTHTKHHKHSLCRSIWCVQMPPLYTKLQSKETPCINKHLAITVIQSYPTKYTQLYNKNNELLYLDWRMANQKLQN